MRFDLSGNRRRGDSGQMFLEKSTQIPMLRIAVLESRQIAERESKSIEFAGAERSTIAQPRNATKRELAVGASD